MAAEWLRTLFSGGGTGNGVWEDVSQLNAPWSISFIGTFAADTYKVRVSNKATRPADSDAETQFGSDVTAAGKVEVTAAYKWAKVEKTAGPTNIRVEAYGQLMHG